MENESPRRTSLSHSKDRYFVQYGAGLCAPEGWKNYDASPSLRAQKIPIIGRIIRKKFGPPFPKSIMYGDIVKGLPIRESSCDGIYCSHVLEHLSLCDFRIAIRNTLSYLKPEGVFRFVLPDLRFLANKYVSHESPESSVEFMKESHLGYLNRPRGLSGLAKSWIGNSLHLWMWDYASISHELYEAGFVNIRRAVLGDSVEPFFCSAETPNRWEDCLGVECKRRWN